jgi:CRISPR-associated endonuclease/helicase Cas3
MTLRRSDFSKFFEAIHGYEPFPWQKMLVERVLDEGWPDLLDLPTASGKTACLDIAVFTLAFQAGMQRQERTTPRRIFFVVDRRIVVDEAYERAEKIAAALAQALDKRGESIVRTVAQSLCDLACGDHKTALAVARLRGGIGRAAVLPSHPLQPSIISATVDQIGSRLLFRSYGGSDRVAPVHAALVAYDSLIILDEAHCSVPFCQTAAAVRDYLSPKWQQEAPPLAAPLKLMVMTATPPTGLDIKQKFPKRNERSAALEHDLLKERSSAQKLATLELCTGREQDPLVSAAATHVLAQLNAGRQRIAVMVNRVRTAHDVLDALRARQPACELVLLTGRMRPIDRDDLVNRWKGVLKAGSDVKLEKPIVLVTTQCLEVGADFSFDALITECASVDALLQRFGRLDRLGEIGHTEACILVRAADIKNGEDPIYGSALAATWQWLKEQKDQPVDFGIDVMRRRISGLDDATRDTMLAPHPNAPVLMPAHVDLLCQTAPVPVPDPDVAAYLHGLGRGDPEVRVAFRADLADDATKWSELLQVCPPAALECLSVPLWRMRRWLAGVAVLPPEDVEGIATSEENDENAGNQRQRFAVFRDGAWEIHTNSEELRGGDMVVLPRDPNDPLPNALGTFLDGAFADRADEAYWCGQRRALLRIHPDLLAPYKEHTAITALLTWAKESAQADEPDLQALREILATLASSPPVPWLGQLAGVLCKIMRAKHVARHPCRDSAWIIVVPLRPVDLDDDMGDVLSESSEPVELNAHLADVAATARVFASAAHSRITSTLVAAGRWHDAGKIDPRFQAWLRKESEFFGGTLWAKGDTRPRGTSGLRHEMLSVQLLETQCPEVLDAVDRELLLHLVAAHHGHARPFAPWQRDTELPALDGIVNGRAMVMEEADRRALPAPCALGSGIADRFWQLTRRYGWWGLAYLEMLVRLADWEASAHSSQVRSNAEAVI